MTTRNYVLVGSGVAAATIAMRLLEQGKANHIVMLEAGPYVKMADYRKWIDFLTTGRAPYEGSLDQNVDLDCDRSRFVVEGSRLFVRGGSTVHWGGWCFRFKPEDFRLGTNARQGIDWAIGYDDIEPYYHAAELFLNVSGDSGNEDPPRHGKSYPIPEVPYSIMDGPIAKALTDLSFSFSHVPISRNLSCATTGTCKYCPIGGRYDATMTLDELQSKFPGKITLHLNKPVQKILMKAKSLAYGVQYLDAENQSVGVTEAEAVILCAGALETPKLLLASTSTWWPNGLANNTGHVGRHLVSHPLLVVQGILPSNPGRIAQELDFPTMACRHFDSPRSNLAGSSFF